jgi:hypothetical protein
MHATATPLPDATVDGAQGTLLQERHTLRIRALPTKFMQVESDDMETLWVEAGGLDGRLLVATFDPYVTPWARSVFDPSQRTAVPTDTGYTPHSGRTNGYTPMPAEDPCRGLYQRLQKTVTAATEDVMAVDDGSCPMPLHTKGVLLVDADGWALFFDAEASRWAKPDATVAHDARFVFARSTSAHQTVLLHASVARRMERIQPLLAALIGRPLRFAPTFVPTPR